MRACLRIVVAAAVGWAGIAAAGAEDAPYRLYWGDVHGHTALSDGKGTLDDYFTHARDRARLDFAIVTDHDFGNAAPWRMPRADWNLIQEKADRYTVDGRIVAVAGYEWTSQPKYWTREEPIFQGPIKYYNHKNVYFPSRVEYLFSAKEAAWCSPDLLAAAVARHGGLVHNNHLDPGPEGRDQFDYTAAHSAVIANTEMGPDAIRYQGKTYQLGWERMVNEFLKRGGRTGFVGASDTHEGKPAARTAVYAKALTRPALFEALRHRRNYAVSHARIALDFRIDGHLMGSEIETEGPPRISVEVRGTDKVVELLLVRDGEALRTIAPDLKDVSLEHVDRTFSDKAYYYVRVTQADSDEHGNPSRAWSSPIWVRRKR